ncbi:mannose-6-phosphate isomerase, class I [Macrococcoides caseolyticum]|uniref:mannose-6-phosphate isomerase, class I n=1 Tax=Macrococcoides caseolyticum TaxID=69966 RepID=UPI001C5EA1BB|nr:mannose-6-phosphate isomerase, class I [Macrococcus caseolyticus]MDJ1153257.1 mannose-6-phosphate isomerase, class I [Macrococcus caseolyticus]QYA40410.1 mannose-6-phosphate isomerase, class I [Macrococcus caseolyticus]
MTLMIQPIFKERIWGGNHLKEFGYEIPNDKIGECWGISAHEHGPNMIVNGEHEGKTLKELWEENTGLFGVQTTDKFPLLTKILDANDELSVQVHPDDAYAQVHENGELGKTECWYIIDCDEDAEIIYGHNANDKAELEDMIQEGKWNQLFNSIKVKPGDFFYVPSGTVHAIGKGIRILETQQNSDTTYRIYDYDRTDKDGHKRELHIEQSIDVISFNKDNSGTEAEVTEVQGNVIRTYISNSFFTVKQLLIEDHYEYTKQQDYTLMSVLSGEGTLTADGQVYTIRKGDHFILTTEDKEIKLQGKLDIIESYV